MDVDDRVARQEMEIETIRHGLDDVQTALESMASRLGQLSEGQEALELQTALLSKAAEDSGFASETLLALPPGDAGPLNAALEGLQQQIDRLAQGLQTATGQADSRIEALSTARQHLEREVAGLRTRVSALHPAETSKPPESASGTGTATDKMLRTLVDEVRALKTAGGMVHDRIVRLEKRRSGLQDTLNALSLQQVRTDHGSRQLQRRFRRLSVLATASILVIGALLVWLVMPRLGAERVIETAASTEGAEQSARAQVAELRLEVSLLEDAVASVTRTVDDLAAAPGQGPEFVEQLDEMRTTIAALRKAQAQQRLKEQAMASRPQTAQRPGGKPEREITTSDARIDEASSAVSDQAEGQEDATSMAPTGPSLSANDKAPVPPINTVARTRMDTGHRWQEARQSGHYTLQLLGVRQQRHLDAFLERHQLDGDIAIYHRTRAGQVWMELLHGIFPTFASAARAARDLPPDLIAQQPWVRRIPANGRLEPL